MSPDRRTFLAGALATGGMALSGMGRAAAQGAAGPLIFDAMGEMRLEYDGDLIKQIKASGLNAITVTLTDPKVSGQRAQPSVDRCHGCLDVHAARRAARFSATVWAGLGVTGFHAKGSETGI